MILFLTIHSLLFTICYSVPFGKVNKTRFTSRDLLNSEAIWLSNQLTPEKCLCTVLSQYNNTPLFNSYQNGSCQIFFSLPYTYTMEYRNDSTLILLSSLPSRDIAPCCSNLPWLIKRITNSSLSSISLNTPSYLVIDDYNYLAVLYNSYTLNRYNRTTMTLISSTTIGSQTMALSYYNKQYYITKGVSHLSNLVIYSTATMINTLTVPIQKDPRDYVFIQNGSIMVVPIQTLQLISFYNVTSPTSYTLSFSLSAPAAPNTLYRVSDTLFYMSTGVNYGPIYTLAYNSTTNSWIWGTMPLTKSDITTNNFQSTMDACGRLWVAINGYGIKIFDTYGTKLLYNLTITTGLNEIVLAKKFDLYVADNDNNKLLSYLPKIDQCTS
ncbi:unnamed protein product [Adineta steineri]|uniref:Uncharacterized protein n=1 Tax=Adineta steineri TaxID=433720 RepID=A0A814LL82_9BILA|nr:unnamed protein product [Adineta steineri]